MHARAGVCMYVSMRVYYMKCEGPAVHRTLRKIFSVESNLCVCVHLYACVYVHTGMYTNTHTCTYMCMLLLNFWFLFYCLHLHWDAIQFWREMMLECVYACACRYMHTFALGGMFIAYALGGICLFACVDCHFSLIVVSYFDCGRPLGTNGFN